MRTIAEQMYYVIKKQDKWARKEQEIQAKCPHEHVEKKYKGNTGNYDPSADSYWIEFRCPDCKKSWIEDQ